MNSVEARKKNTRTMIVLVIFLALMAAVIAFIVSSLTENTTHTSGDSTSEAASYLTCTGKNIDIQDAFFNTKDTEASTQTFKAIFKNNKIDALSYSASLTYKDEATASQKEAELHVKFGNYVQKNGKDANDFSPSFASSKNEVKINIFADRRQLAVPFAKIFLIDISNTGLSSYDVNRLSSLYNSKGLNCRANK